ncbi:hypothetical protein [Actinacidiphila paucisporea]|uniref:hypothetical protein n=1 Tax=Actinacidiphila paucisporea TaxID=310782 RepID=UPI00190EF374|nr:hypothetical protein [Actinacidiphila paucisporea]
MVGTYETLADAIDSAQRTLDSALEYAGSHGLTVSGAGEVTNAATGRTDTTVLDYQIGVATGLVTEALNAATTADATASTKIRTIEGVCTVTGSVP